PWRLTGSGIPAFSPVVLCPDKVLQSAGLRQRGRRLQKLRTVGGLTTGEIAHAFLVPEATMAQRISRAKQSIKASGVPFRLPTNQERTERLRNVLHVLYLIFNEGYTSSVGSNLQRHELSAEAIRLARTVHALLPDD